jgi:hypothetical protein
MPDLIREAFDYFEKEDAPNSNEQTKEELLSENMKMKELGHRIAEWRKAAPDEVPTQRERENTRITSRDIFGLPGSATGEEAMAILKAKEDERLAKKAQDKDKKSKDKCVKVIVGAALIDKIMRHGIYVLDNLKKDKLYA